MPKRFKFCFLKNAYNKIFLFLLIVLLQYLSFVKPDSFFSYSAFFCLVPVLFLVKNTGILNAAFIGFVAGAASLGINSFWLGSYHPIGIIIGMALGAFWFSVAFALSAIVFKTDSKYAAIASALIWVLCEWGRSYGFIAFPYASLPYSQAERSLAYSLASYGGTTFLGLLIALAGASFYYTINYYLTSPSIKLKKLFKYSSFALVLIVFMLIAGKNTADKSDSSVIAVNPEEEHRDGYLRVALIQPCINKQKSIQEYNYAFDSLSQLSMQALKYKPDLVVWHETALVPPIEWHYKYRPDRAVYDFSARVKEFLSNYPAAILTGNSFVQLDDDRRLKEYNSALLYNKGKLEQRYAKIKLVAFSEYLPAFLNFKFISEPIIAELGRFWTAGSERVIFTLGEASFASPICFEDSFGAFLASFDAPDFFTVLTNDSWAKSEYMQKQHLAMSRFRAAETASIIIRAADTGSTSAINSKGMVLYELKAMEPAILAVDIKLGTAKKTFYERYHFIIDVFIAVLAVIFITLSFISKNRDSFPLNIDNKDGL